MKLSDLKKLDISLHIAVTGAGAGLQDELWQVPGSSAYLSGASFPYAPEEHEELVGFKPEHYCSEEDAIDLASAAYMKAYRFGGKKPVGIGITASVASEKEHRGEHRIFGCIITEDKVLSYSTKLEKGSGSAQRFIDGQLANHVGIVLLNETFDYPVTGCKDATELATQRFWNHSLFMPTGQRLDPKSFNLDSNLYSLMPGAFNPPHEGHFGLANAVKLHWGTDVIFEVCATHPIKPSLTVQQMLQRAKLLRGHHILFTQDRLYIDKARSHPNMALVVGADAMLRMLDPQWGIPTEDLLKSFYDLGTDFFIGSRLVNGKLISKNNIIELLPPGSDMGFMFRSIPGQWNISSTEIRNKT
jgi:nicotinic acid mononucleotide adenylyltransferase